MSVYTRVKTWVAGDVLTAADLNGEFDLPATAINGGLDETNFTTLEGLLTWAISTNVGGILINKSGAGAELVFAGRSVERPPR